MQGRSKVNFDIEGQPTMEAFQEVRFQEISESSFARRGRGSVRDKSGRSERPAPSLTFQEYDEEEQENEETAESAQEYFDHGAPARDDHESFEETYQEISRAGVNVAEESSADSEKSDDRYERPNNRGRLDKAEGWESEQEYEQLEVHADVHCANSPGHEKEDNLKGNDQLELTPGSPKCSDKATQTEEVIYAQVVKRRPLELGKNSGVRGVPVASVIAEGLSLPDKTPQRPESSQTPREINTDIEIDEIPDEKCSYEEPEEGLADAEWSPPPGAHVTDNRTPKGTSVSIRELHPHEQIQRLKDMAAEIEMSVLKQSGFHDELERQSYSGSADSEGTEERSEGRNVNGYYCSELESDQHSEESIAASADGYDARMYLKQGRWHGGRDLLMMNRAETMPGNRGSARGMSWSRGLMVNCSLVCPVYVDRASQTGEDCCAQVVRRCSVDPAKGGSAHDSIAADATRLGIEIEEEDARTWGKQENKELLLQQQLEQQQQQQQHQPHQNNHHQQQQEQKQQQEEQQHQQHQHNHLHHQRQQQQEQQQYQQQPPQQHNHHQQQPQQDHQQHQQRQQPHQHEPHHDQQQPEQQIKEAAGEARMSTASETEFPREEIINGMSKEIFRELRRRRRRRPPQREKYRVVRHPSASGEDGSKDPYHLEAQHVTSGSRALALPPRGFDRVKSPFPHKKRFPFYEGLVCPIQHVTFTTRSEPVGTATSSVASDSSLFSLNVLSEEPSDDFQDCETHSQGARFPKDTTFVKGKDSSDDGVATPRFETTEEETDYEAAILRNELGHEGTWTRQGNAQLQGNTAVTRSNFNEDKSRETEVRFGRATTHGPSLIVTRPLGGGRSSGRHNEDSACSGLGKPDAALYFAKSAIKGSRRRGEIKLLAGEVVKVMRKESSGWWQVKSSNKTGWAPASVFQKVSEGDFLEANHPNGAVRGKTTRANEKANHALCKSPGVMGRKTPASIPGLLRLCGEEEVEILAEDDRGYVFVIVAERFGWIPKTSVERMTGTRPYC